MLATLRLRCLQLFIPIIGLLLLGGCNHKTLTPSPLPASWAATPVSQFRPPELIDDLIRWRPGDWRTQLLVGMTSTSDSLRAYALFKADSLHPHEPLILIQAGMVAWRMQQWKTATECFLAASEIEPENAWLDLFRARAQMLSGEIPKARMIFYEDRNFNNTDTYALRMERILLSLMADAGKLNPFSLADARSLFAVLEISPLESSLNALYEIFLFPLEQRPYDIRKRAPNAAYRMAWLGKELRKESLRGPSILWNGQSERDLGYAYEAQAWAFLDLFGRTFQRRTLSLQAMEEQGNLLAEADIIFKNSDIQKYDPMQIYLTQWQNWIQQDPLTLGRACQWAERSTVWKQALRMNPIP